MSVAPQALASPRARAARVVAAPVSWEQVVRGLVQMHTAGSVERHLASESLSSSALVGQANAILLAGAAAEAAVHQGLKAPLLADLASAAGVDVRWLYEFAGIDRTTVARRAARDDVLPHEAAVKALEFAELMGTAVDVFGAVPAGAAWLTRSHPLLDEQTPLQRARTPWGKQRVLALLGALKYGAAA
jgi:putative toxin-antitoxin system antitoxin component (TIGR02293 family)